MSKYEKHLLPCEKTFLKKVREFYKHIKDESYGVRRRKIVEKEELNKKQRLLFDIVISHASSRNYQLSLACVGQAGSGKSHVLDAVTTFFDRSDIKYCVLSATGNSAFNCGGVTFHHALQIPIFLVNGKPESYTELLKNRWRKYEYVLIDEIGMVGLNLLSFASRRVKFMFMSPLPFGGKHLIYFGDFFQVRPVLDISLYKTIDQIKPDKRENLNMLAGMEAYAAINKVIFLEENVRQKIDPVYGEILSRIRVSKLLPRDVSILNTRTLDKLSRKELQTFFNEALYLFPERKQTRAHNKLKLEALREPIETLPETFPDHAPQHVVEENRKHPLRLAKGARVFITTNYAPGYAMYNGTLGIVDSFIKSKDGYVLAVMVKPDTYLGPKYARSETFPVIRMEMTSTDEKGNTHSSFGFPIKLSWAMTIHKCQSLTVDKVILCMPEKDYCINCMYNMNCPALAYSAMSRVRRLADIAFDQEFVERIVTKKGATLAQNLIEEKRLLDLEEKTIACWLEVLKLVKKSSNKK